MDRKATKRRKNSRRDGSSARVIMDSLRRIVRALRLFDRAAERRVGLSGAQVFVLEKLRDGLPATVNELAARTRTHQSSVSVVARKLVEGGLLRRLPGGADRRRVELVITARGVTMLKSAPAAAQNRLIDAIGRMPARRQQQLAKLMVEWVAGTGMDDETPALFFEDSSGKPRRGPKQGIALKNK